MAIPKSKARRVFVSHSHKDNEFCNRLVQALQHAGLDVWYDANDLHDPEIEIVLERELRSRDAYIVVLSPAAVESRWVRAEINEALERYDNGQIQYLLPVIAAPCDLPLRLKPLLWTDFVNQTFEKALASLLRHMGFTDGEAQAAVNTADMKVPTIWEMKDSLTTHVSTFGLAWSPDGRLLAAGAHDKKVHIWDIAARREVLALVGHENWVDAVAWSPDGKTIASASQGTRVRLWDATSGKQIAVLEGHTGSVTDVSWSADGRSLVSGSTDHSVRIWNIASGRCVQILKGQPTEITSVDWSPDGMQVGATARNALVYVWDANTGTQQYTLAGHQDVVHCMRWSPDQKMIATSGHTSIRVWDTKTRDVLHRFMGHRGHVVTVAWRSDNRLLASGSADFSVRLWDVRGEKIAITPGTHRDWVHAVTWSPNGQLLATGGGMNDGTIKLWGPA